MPANDLIQSFVARYRREYDFYYEVARLAAQRCEELSAENGIRGIVTFRAKRPDRLEEKLIRRDDEKHYQTEDEIRADIVDLSGVRIALYFPSDRAKIAALLSEAFIVDEVKEFRGKPKTNSRQRFDGYYADHYRVQLGQNTLPEANRRYAGSPVEIQVASVLMHAWSEVEHDLVYKPLSGTVSQDELQILDGLNGIVLSGEVFLERLQAAFEARVSQTGTTFSNQYELAAFLYDHLRTTISPSGAVEPVMGRVDILFRLLQTAELARPDRLLPYLENLDAETERRPLADQVADRILAARPELYDQYLEMRRTLGSTARLSGVGANAPSPEIIGSFLHNWIVLERFSRALARVRRPDDRRVGFMSPRIWRDVLPPQQVSQLERLQRLRNNLVHGIAIPEDELLAAADHELASLLSALEASNNPDVREAIRWARSTDPDPEMR